MSNNFLGKLKDMIGGGQSDLDYEQEMENMATQDLSPKDKNPSSGVESKVETPSPSVPPLNKSADNSRKTEKTSSYSNRGSFSRNLPDNVIGMPGVNNIVNEVVIIEPHSPDDIPQVIQTLREQRCVILNLNIMEPDEAQRALDFVAGGTYAIDGVQERIGESIFLFTPRNVRVSTITGKSYQNKSAGFTNDNLTGNFTESLWEDSGSFTNHVAQ